MWAILKSEEEGRFMMWLSDLHLNITMNIVLSPFELASMFQQTFSISMDIALSPFELSSVFQQTFSISTDIALSPFELSSVFQQTFSISTTYRTKCQVCTSVLSTNTTKQGYKTKMYNKKTTD